MIVTLNSIKMITYTNRATINKHINTEVLNMAEAMADMTHKKISSIGLMLHRVVNIERAPLNSLQKKIIDLIN